MTEFLSENSLTIELSRKVVDLPSQAVGEEHQPRIPLCTAAAECRLRSSEGDAISFLVRLYHAFERRIRHICVTGTKHQKRRQNPRHAAVAILERMDRQKADDEDRRSDQWMKLAVRVVEPCNELFHQAGSIEWCRRFENDSDLTAVGIERGYVVWKRFVFAPMRCILGDVLEQHGVYLFDVIFGRADLVRRPKDQIH